MSTNLDRYLASQGVIYPMVNVADARKLAKAFWAERGVSFSYLLTLPEDNAKLSKSAVPTYGLALAPAAVSGEWNTCAYSTPQCRKGCLNTAGRGIQSNVQRGRILKTQFLAEYPDAFLAILKAELEREARKNGAGRILMRLNVLSDLSWEVFAPWLFDISGVDFYDYTKNKSRALAAADEFVSFPSNYRLVYSASERDEDSDIQQMLDQGVNVTVIFADAVPEMWCQQVLRGTMIERNVTVVNGDLTDNRYDDPRGVVVGLKAKGKLKDREEFPVGGFVRESGSLDIQRYGKVASWR